MKLGIKVRDVISGFSGVITGHVVYITGCNQSLVQPPSKENGDLVENRWIDDDRLEIVDSVPIVLKINNSGPDREAPRR